MLKINNLHKTYGSQTLFDGISLQMNAGERLGLVGRNGHGKSTLFRIILKQEDADSGVISIPKNYRVGHLEQHLHFTKNTILEEGCLGLPPGEEDYAYKVEAILFGLGFTASDMSRAPQEFSGGYQIRLNLAKVLVSEPNLLLLDEPTNYLDIVSMRWLTEFLRDWPGELILISHDREFMDAVCTHTAAIHRQKLKKMAGSTQKVYDQIILEEEIHEKTRVNDEKKRKDMEVFINRFRAKASKASVVQSRVKLLEKLPRLSELSAIETLDFEFRYAPFSAKTLMEITNLSFGYNKDQLLFKNLNLSIQAQDRIGIIGKNGRGKSTLLNVLAGEFVPLSGNVRTHPDLKLGYFGQTNISRLTPSLTIEKEIQNANPNLSRTQVRNICGTMMFDGDNAEKKISVLSGGEKSRTLLGKILAQPSNLLFLDEPTNHLDMESIDSLVESIGEYQGALLIVTHSERILREVATKLAVFQNGELIVYPYTYDEFLERVGWQEDNVSASGTAQTPKPSELSYAQNKAENKAEKQKRKKLEKIESTIVEQEKKLSDLNLELVQASQNKNIDRIMDLTKQIDITRKNIEELYQEWQGAGAS